MQGRSESVYPMLIARMEPRHALAVNALAWSCGAGPAFAETIANDLGRPGAQAYVAVVPVDVLAPVPLSVTPLWQREWLVGYVQLIVRDRYLVIEVLNVDELARRRRVGSRLLRLALQQLSTQRPVAFADVPDSTRFLAAHCFLKQSGFIGRLHRRDKRLLRFDYCFGQEPLRIYDGQSSTHDRGGSNESPR